MTDEYKIEFTLKKNGDVIFKDEPYIGNGDPQTLLDGARAICNRLAKNVNDALKEAIKP